MCATNRALDQPAASRPLHYRAIEHIYAASKKDGTSPFGEHYKACHLHQKPDITFRRHLKPTTRNEQHVRIATEIQSRKPAPNKKREDRGTGFWHSYHKIMA